MASLEERVKEIVVQQLGVTPEQVTPDAKFVEDLGADSLDLVELIMEFEKQFGAEVPDSESEKLKTVGDAIAYLQKWQADHAGKV